MRHQHEYSSANFLAAALIVLASISCFGVSASGAENLALRRPYTLVPAPDYPYCTDAGDATDLTDGKRVAAPDNKALWVMPGTVGWGQGGDRFIKVEIDLGQRCDIEGVSFSTVAGASDVTFPLSVMVFLSDDGERYGYAGDVLTEAVSQERYVVHVFRLQGLKATGRHVRLVVLRGGFYCFCDEIEVWGRRGAKGEAAPRSLSREQADKLARDRASLARQNQSSLTLLRLARERLAEESGRFPNAEQKARAALDELQAKILARAAAESTDYRRGVPYTALDREIGQAMGGYHQAVEKPGTLLSWPAHPYAPLRPFDRPTGKERPRSERAGATPAELSTRLMAGEWGELALNLTNATPVARKAVVTVERLEREQQKLGIEAVRLFEVVFVDAFGFRTVADALAPLAGALDLPAGMTRQLWLSIRTRGLQPGTYTGTLRIESAEDAARRVPFQFEVVPVEMPEQPALLTANFSYHHWPVAAKFPQDFARDQREHYASAQVVPPQAMPFPKADAAGNFTEPLDFTSLDKYLALLPETRLWILWPGFEWDYGNMAPREGDARRTKLFTRWVKDVLAHMAEKGYGYDRVAFFWVDEPGQKAMREIVDPCSRLLRRIDPKAKVWMDITGDNTAHSVRAQESAVDIWCPEETMANWEFWKGKRRWFYTCASNKGHSPTGYYRRQLWEAFDWGCEGHAFWVYTDDAQNLWDDYAGKMPSYGVVYDGAAGVVSSKRWEAYRAGIEDHQLCRMLAAAIQAGKAQGDAPAVRAAREALEKQVRRVISSPGDPIAADRAHDLLLGHLIALTRKSPYLGFVRETVDTLIARQSMRLSGNPYPSSPLSITITSLTNRGYLSLGSRNEKSFYVFPFPTKSPDERATRIDLGSWPVLRKLSQMTGDSRYDDLVQTMAETFAQYGFDPRSGLAYWGQEAEFDAVLLGPGTNWGRWMPKYKPADGLPRDIMWKVARKKMARMSKAAYYGLITDQQNLDYNRFCAYGFDDREKKPSMSWDAGHRAFITTAAWLIEDWIDHSCRTGDKETLDWARRMTAKLAAAQNPHTGLMSHFFGSIKPEQKTMHPQPFCDAFSDSWTAMALLRAGRQLQSHGSDPKLAEQLQQMGRALITGLARYSYDESSGLFRQWLLLADGQEDREALTYTFRTQEQKDHWVKIDPQLKDVSVFEGFGFYRGGVWSDGTRWLLPLHTARAAEMTGDPYLKERAKFFADRVMEAASKLDGPLNKQGQWTYDATAGYIELMLVLRRLTGDPSYLDRARKLADMELAHLKQPTPVEWWRMSYRNTLLAALLSLAEAD